MVFEFCSKNRKPLLAFLINRRKRTTQSCTHLHGIVRSFVRKNRHKSLTISRQSMETNNQSDFVYIKHRGTKFCNNLSGNGQERHGVCGFVRQPQRGCRVCEAGKSQTCQVQPLQGCQCMQGRQYGNTQF